MLFDSTLVTALLCSFMMCDACDESAPGKVYCTTDERDGVVHYNKCFCPLSSCSGPDVSENSDSTDHTSEYSCEARTGYLASMLAKVTCMTLGTALLCWLLFCKGPRCTSTEICHGGICCTHRQKKSQERAEEREGGGGGEGEGGGVIGADQLPVLYSGVVYAEQGVGVGGQPAEGSVVEMSPRLSSEEAEEVK